MIINPLINNDAIGGNNGNPKRIVPDAKPNPRQTAKSLAKTIFPNQATRPINNIAGPTEMDSISGKEHLYYDKEEGVLYRTEYNPGGTISTFIVGNTNAAPIMAEGDDRRVSPLIPSKREQEVSARMKLAREWNRLFGDGAN